MASPANTTETQRATVRPHTPTRDELFAAARSIGLSPPKDIENEALAALIHAREAVLDKVSLEAMREVLHWADRPVDATADKAALARQIAAVEKMHFEGLTHRGLVAYARLRGVAAENTEPAEVMIDRIKRSETLSQFFRRKKRKFLGSIISRMLSSPDDESAGDAGVDTVSVRKQLKREIESQGVVGGLAKRIRGVADDYVREKLDEIEQRIDRKLDQIDNRLAEWRDREIANRLRIIKLTLAMTVVVAIISLGYSWARSQWPTPDGAEEARPAAVQTAMPTGDRELESPKTPTQKEE